ncbi:MAG: hypothetical protein AAB871_01315 [Patescibacteria group bacterium]
MNMVHYREVALRDMAWQARYVLLVKKIEPFVEYVDVLIGEDSVKYPPFKKTKYHFVVSGRMDMSGDGPKIGDKIVAIDANFPRKLKVHKLFYLENRRKSPIYERYESRADFLKEKELILFVSIVANGEYLFCAFESMSRMEEVKKILGSLPPRPVDLAEEAEIEDVDVHKPPKPQ